MLGTFIWTVWIFPGYTLFQRNPPPLLYHPKECGRSVFKVKNSPRHFPSYPLLSSFNDLDVKTRFQATTPWAHLQSPEERCIVILNYRSQVPVWRSFFLDYVYKSRMKEKLKPEGDVIFSMDPAVSSFWQVMNPLCSNFVKILHIKICSSKCFVRKMINYPWKTCGVKTYFTWWPVKLLVEMV